MIYNSDYRHAASLIKNKLRWDLNIRSIISNKNLRNINGKYKGKKAVILCNGPSLLKTDFELIQNSGVYTFGLNKINLLFDKTHFRPSCIVAVNPFVIEQNMDFFKNTKIPLYLDSKKKVKNSSVTYLYSSSRKGVFSSDLVKGINQGHTVTYVAMQLAYFMGFKEVALVGCDHNFAVKGEPNKTVVSGEEDLSHFDPNYFAGGVKWQLPDLVQSEIAYMLAREHYLANGGKIVNCTDGGKLEVFPRVALDEFLNNV